MKECTDFWYVLGKPEKRMSPKAILGPNRPLGHHDEAGQLFNVIARTPMGMIPGMRCAGHEP